MSTFLTTMRYSAAFALIALVLAAPAGAAGQDLRSPDARDAASTTAATSGWQDLRAPDSIDLRDDAFRPSGTHDLRSPDAREPFAAPRTVEPIAAPSPGGFPWAYLAVGITLAAAVVATTAAGVRRRRRIRAAIA